MRLKTASLTVLPKTDVPVHVERLVTDLLAEAHVRDLGPARAVGVDRVHLGAARLSAAGQADIRPRLAGQALATDGLDDCRHCDSGLIIQPDARHAPAVAAADIEVAAGGLAVVAASSSATSDQGYWATE
jgi:hypothetical protein